MLQLITSHLSKCTLTLHRSANVHYIVFLGECLMMDSGCREPLKAKKQLYQLLRKDKLDRLLLTVTPGSLAVEQDLITESWYGISGLDSKN